MGDVISQGARGTLARKNAAVALTSGLNHYWDLDGGTGWADDAGGWTLSENGSVTDLATGGPDGGSAANFDSDADYLHTGIDHSWDGAQDTLTTSIWAYVDTFDSVGNWFFSWRGNSLSLLTQSNTTTSESNAVKGTVWDNADTASAPVGSALSTATWYHVVLTDDGTTRTLYLNGSSVATDTTSIIAYSTNGMPMALGTASFNKGSSTLSHRGRLAMCGIWERALSASEVTTLYNSGSGLRYAAL